MPSGGKISAGFIFFFNPCPVNARNCAAVRARAVFTSLAVAAFRGCPQPGERSPIPRGKPPGAAGGCPEPGLGGGLGKLMAFPPSTGSGVLYRPLSFALLWPECFGKKGTAPSLLGEISRHLVVPNIQNICPGVVQLCLRFWRARPARERADP